MSQASELATPGRTVIIAARHQEVAGLLVLEDAVWSHAAETVKRRQRIGIRTVLVTGDNQNTADRTARELGIPEVHAEVLSADKAEMVPRFQAAGHRVAFVGDGVNDGPALAFADVGVAMGRGGPILQSKPPRSASSLTT